MTNTEPLIGGLIILIIVVVGLYIFFRITDSAEKNNKFNKEKKRFIEERKVEINPVAEKVIKKEDDYAWACDYCGEEFESKTACLGHEKECSDNPKNVKKEVEEEHIWTCDYCGEEFESETSCLKHEKKCSDNPKNIKKVKNISSKTKFCTECGSEYSKNSKFCTECGNKLDYKQQEEKESDDEDTEVVETKSRNSHGFLKFFFIMIVILLILFFVVPIFPKYNNYSYQETVNADNCEKQSGCICEQRGHFLWLTCVQCSCTKYGTTTSYRTMAQMVFK